MIPTPFELVLLALAAYRLWRLLAEDDLTDRLRRYLLRLGDWQAGDEPPDGYRERLGEFVACPWCFGFWLSLGAYGCWLAAGDYAVAVAVPFALSALVGAVARLLD